MKISLEINNKSQSPVAGAFLKNIFRETLEQSGYVFLSGQKISLSVALVSKGEIKKLNARWRKINKTTDVLSFSEYRNKGALEKAVEKEVFLGELVMCYDEIAGYSKKNKLSAKKEIANVFSHGILHLLGLRHGGKMFGIQDKVKKVLIKNSSIIYGQI